MERNQYISGVKMLLSAVVLLSTVEQSSSMRPSPNINAAVDAVGASRKTALYLAVEKGDIKKINFLLNHGANINTALQGVRKGDIETINFLLNHGADINTAFYCAIRKGDIETINFLLNRGEDINKWPFSESPLKWAFDFEDIDAIKAIMPFWRKDINVPCGVRQTLLTIAVGKGNIEIIEYLLSCGADINAVNGWKETPLVFAISMCNNPNFRGGRLKVVEYLLKHGANASTPDPKGKFPLELAIELEDSNLLSYLLEHGADVNVIPNGRSPLWLAILSGKLDLVSCLLEHGANTKFAVGTFRETPVHLAVSLDREDLLSCLMAHGADINATDKYGSTPLASALDFDKKRTYRVLIDAGAQRFIVPDSENATTSGN
jgi:ankyrin repeat protein